MVGISEKFKCQICSLEFSESSSVGEHLDREHINHRNLVAPREDVMGHVEIDKSLLPEKSVDTSINSNQTCQFCGRHFRHERILEIHMKSCKSLQKRFVCSTEYCDYVTFDNTISPHAISSGKRYTRKYFARRGSHSTHGNLVQGQDQSEESAKSPRTFQPRKTKVLSERHSRFLADRKEVRVSCAYCMKSFGRKYDAIFHVRKSHPNKLEEFLIWLQRRKLYLKDKLCTLCNKTFVSTEVAISHCCRKEESETIWDCELCLTKFSNEMDLLRHIVDHSPFEDGIQITFKAERDEKLFPSNEEKDNLLPDMVISGESNESICNPAN